jgi:hypothetical protein
MKLKLKEDPREWRKVTLLSAAPVAVIVTLLCWWKHTLTQTTWFGSLIALALVMVCACAKPRWFRGYYRVSNKAGFWLSQTIGLLVLAIFFFVVMTPIGLAMRLFGKDTLRLKRPRDAETYWNAAKSPGPLDRLF